jgi:cytochrome c biogenesis protein CcmG, thiol:disulfide interchange protein DsbE
MTVMYFIALGMLAVGGTFIFFLVRRSGFLFPADPVERLGVILSGLLVIASTVLLVLTYMVDTGSYFEPVDRAGYPRLTSQEMNAPAPPFSFQLVADESTMSLEDFAGQVVVINFWATWCAPCLTELPDLNALHDAYRDRGLAVLTISDESRRTLLDFESRLPLSTVSGYVSDPRSLPDPYRRTFQVRPSTYVVDRQGIIREFILGARDYSTFERMIAPHLEAPLPTG